MASADLQSPIFTDETAAREALEAVRWPHGPVCPHCGSLDKIGKVEGKSHRPGLYYCGACKGQFTVKVGTVFERSKIPLTKWWLASHLLSSSKKGLSAHQLGRMLGLTYKSAWFMAHRIREAMRELQPDPLGGVNKVVEIDETYVGGKARNRKNRIPKKSAVVALVERDGNVRSFNVANVSGENLKPILVSHVNRASYVMTDESPVYPGLTADFAGHGTVNHSAEEYARGTFWHTNTAENYFSIFKRGIVGTYHHVSEAHLHRYAGRVRLSLQSSLRTWRERLSACDDRDARSRGKAPHLSADSCAAGSELRRAFALSLPPKPLCFSLCALWLRGGLLPLGRNF